MADLLLAAFTYDPIQRLGPVSPHGVGTALGFLAGAVLAARRAEPRGIPKNETYNAVTWGALGALIGARGFYVLGHLDQFDSVGEALQVWQGGLTMFGGFIGGLAFGLYYLYRRGFSVVQMIEAAAPSFVVGVIIGRIGDIIIADHLGRPTDFFAGYRIPNAEIAPGYGPPTYVPGAVVHHPAVYDLLGALVLLGFVYWLGRRHPRPGTLFAAFAVWYGLQRLLIDFTRNREVIETVVFGFSGSQWAGIGFAVGGALALLRLSGQPRPAGEYPPPSPADHEPTPVGPTAPLPGHDISEPTVAPVEAAHPVEPTPDQPDSSSSTPPAPDHPAEPSAT